ncbi:MAG: YggS family pyridoxal phosphate-dependent enzyme [Bacillus sp. (in: firmicutes)]
MKVTDNLAAIHTNIENACKRSSRTPEDIKIIAVTKYVSVERTAEAIAAGIQNIGENRQEGLLHKQAALRGEAVWHFIGTLQTRKVKDVINHVDYVHSLDRLSLAKEIEKRAEAEVSCFLQVNASGEESKHGLAPGEVSGFLKELEGLGLKKVKVVGLMTMAPFTEDEEAIRSCFRELKSLQLQVQQMELPFAPCRELSMGMSNDYEIAIEEGSTFIRIGTALVGEDS